MSQPSRSTGFSLAYRDNPMALHASSHPDPINVDHSHLMSEKGGSVSIAGPLRQLRELIPTSATGSIDGDDLCYQS